MSETQTTTLTLTEHPERGWKVDPDTGEVFGIAGRWVGKRLGRIGSHGYWVSTVNGRAYLLHRVVWEACVGPIPKGLVINHKNGVKTDNRLANLEVVTPGYNNAHALATGLRRPPRTFGPRNWNYKITPTVHAQVLARLAAGESGASIGRDIGVSDQTISRIKRGERCPS